MHQKKVYDEPQDPAMIAWQAQLVEAQQRPWLASLLLRNSTQYYQRFVHFYHKLQALPRRTRRSLQRRLATTLVGAALLLALSGSPMLVGAQGGRGGSGSGGTSINHGEESGPLNTIIVGGGCTLVDAISSANTDSPVGACTTGSGPDEIILPGGGTYSYTVANNPGGGGGDNALPQIISDITIQGNGASIEREGAAPDFRLFEVAGGSLTLNDVTVSGGSLNGTTWTYGAGVFIGSGTLNVNRSTISGNSITTSGEGARGAGIGASYGDGRITIQDSAIINNVAYGATLGSGGGIGLGASDGSVFIDNSTISGNITDSADAPYGGGAGVYALYGTSPVTINNSTITDNTHTGSILNSAGGVYTYFSGDLMIDNTIISGNTGVNFNDCYTTNLGGTSNSLIGGGECGGTAPTTLGLGPLADNGGPTMTHALLAGSTDAIDVITPGTAGCDAGVSTDQRGAVRADGPGRGGSGCDIGAFEYDSFENPTAVTMQGFSAGNDVGVGVETAVSATLLGTISLAVSSLWLRRRRREQS